MPAHPSEALLRGRKGTEAVIGETNCSAKKLFCGLPVRRLYFQLPQRGVVKRFKIPVRQSLYLSQIRKDRGNGIIGLNALKRLRPGYA